MRSPSPPTPLPRSTGGEGSRESLLEPCHLTPDLDTRGFMREDMAQVIIERPRRGSRLPTKGKGYDRRAARLGWDNAVKAEGIKVRGGRGKSLNENLAPLRRYLASQLGRPWASTRRSASGSIAALRFKTTFAITC